jgi:hypothetical protein
VTRDEAVEWPSSDILPAAVVEIMRNLQTAITEGTMSTDEAKACAEAYLIEFWGDDDSLWPI